MRRVFSGADLVIDGERHRRDLVVEHGRIVAIGPARTTSSERRSDAETVDVDGCVISPGFIDLQCNGAVGVDLTTDPDGIAAVARALPRFGITSFLPTVVTSPAANRRAAIRALERFRSGGTVSTIGADPIGLHLEGPMISRQHLGAHAPAHVAALDAPEVDEWAASHAVRLVTLAPELPGAPAVIERLAGAGITVSAGHTAMTPLDFAAAKAAGLSCATHLFNAMAPFDHRAPGPVGAVLADDDLVAGLICDGIHVDPTAVRLAWRALGPARLALVSDAVAALGSPPGRLRLGDLEVSHDASGVRTLDGILAGSALALDQAVRNLMEFTGCELAEALACVTSTPADLLGLDDRGRLTVGSRADLAILDRDAELVATVIGGVTAWQR
jgi:N-acetylglucosamine-6-phosphate deacetylase